MIGGRGEKGERGLSGNDGPMGRPGKTLFWLTSRVIFKAIALKANQLLMQSPHIIAIRTSFWIQLFKASICESSNCLTYINALISFFFSSIIGEQGARGKFQQFSCSQNVTVWKLYSLERNFFLRLGYQVNIFLFNFRKSRFCWPTRTDGTTRYVIQDLFQTNAYNFIILRSKHWNCFHLRLYFTWKSLREKKKHFYWNDKIDNIFENI